MRSFDESIMEQKWTRDIVSLLEMDQIAPDLFQNRYNQPNAYRALFGGQIVAQALRAADRTAKGRTVHSLHCYFLRAGIHTSQIDYMVERTRDGARFSTRRVVARQAGQIIFTMECSYRTPIEGFSHYRPMSVPFEPEKGLDGRAFDQLLGAANQRYGGLFKGRYPIECGCRTDQAILTLWRTPSGIIGCARRGRSGSTIRRCNGRFSLFCPTSCSLACRFRGIPLPCRGRICSLPALTIAYGFIATCGATTGCCSKPKVPMPRME